MKKLLLSLVVCVLGIVCANATTVYFENTNNWPNVYAYAWTPNNASWPGVKVSTTVTAKNASTGANVTLYAYTIPSNQPNIIFNAGNGQPQTKDLAATDGAVYNAGNISSTAVMGTVTGSGTNLTYTPSGYEVKSYDWYLCGTVNGWAQMDADFGFEKDPTNANIYTLELTKELTSGFKVLSSGSVWYGSGSQVDVSGANVNSTLTMSTGGGDVAFSNTSTTIKDAKLTFNSSTRQLTITGSTGIAQYDLYLLGDVNNWEASPTYKFATSDYNIYTLTLPSFENASAFKIGSEGWIISLTANKKDLTNGTYTLESGGSDNNMAFGAPMKDVTLTVNLSANTLTIDGTIAGDVQTDYSSWWVNLSGAFNGNNFDNTYTQPTAAGIATFTAVEVGTSTFELKTWDGSSDNYYNSCADGDLVPGQWMVISNANMEGAFLKIQDATEGSTYDIQYNCATHEICVTAVDAPVPDTTLPEVVYILGTVNGKSWVTTEGPEAKGDEGVYVWEGVEFTGDDLAYFNLATVLGENWDNGPNTGNRYGALTKDAPLTVGTVADVVLYAKNVNASSCESWSVAVGTYDVTLNLNEMTILLEETPQTEEPEYGENYTATYVLDNVVEAQKYNSSIPAFDDWIADGSTGNKYFSVTELTNEGTKVTFSGGSSVSNQARLYGTATKYDLRIYNTDVVKVEAAPGYTLSTITFTTVNSTNSAIAKMTMGDNEPGTFTNSSDRNMTWTAPETAAVALNEDGTVTSMSFNAGGTIRLSTITVSSVATDVTTAVEGIEADVDATPVYYNLQGVRVANPERGIFIKVVGNKATKVVR